MDELLHKRKEELCPGVYYVSAADGEFYVVNQDAPAISTAAKEYGGAHGEILLYPLNKPDSGWMVVRYEVCKYLARRELPPLEGVTLYEAALFGAECHPEYFGELPVPIYTPLGSTLKHQSLANGIDWIETDRCLEGLAVSFPIWDGELSEAAQELALKQDHLPELPRYLFFNEKASCIPIFELMQIRPDWKQSGIIDQAALMNAIWQNFPAYALAYNGMEQAGLNDIPDTVLNTIGGEISTNSRVERTIRLTPGAGTTFLRKDRL